MKKVAEWVNAHFISAAPLDVLQHGSGSQGSRLCAIFQGIDHEAVGSLWVEAWPASGSAGLEVTVSTDSMEVASEVVMDICREFDVKELVSTALFERETERLKALLERVKELNQLRVRTTGGEFDC